MEIRHVFNRRIGEHFTIRVSIICRKVLLTLLGTIIMQGTATTQNILADFPLIEHLSDITGENSDVSVVGNPDPPAMPSTGNPLCTNGVYIYENNGQHIQSPDIKNFNQDDFAVSIDFRLADFTWTSPYDPSFTIGRPILVGGDLYRWLIVGVDLNGAVTLGFNNIRIVEISTKLLNLDQWYNCLVKYKNGDIELIIDDEMFFSGTIGPLETGNHYDFSTTNFAFGANLQGCWKSLAVSTSTVLGQYQLSTYPSNYAGVNQIKGVQKYDASYQTGGNIESNQIINEPAVVSYDSGESIDLLAGFEVKLGSTFTALIGCCEE